MRARHHPPRAARRRAGAAVLACCLAAACSGDGEASTGAGTAAPTTAAAASSTVTATTNPATIPGEDGSSRTCGGVDRTPGVRTVAVSSGGQAREALVVVPEGVDPTAPVPVLIDLHGHGGSPRQARTAHRFDPLAQAAGVVTVYPQGAIQLDGEAGWATGAPGRDEGSTDDVAFIADLLDVLDAELCTDPAALAVVGHSNGGGMVARLACGLPDRFAAFVAVSGAFHDERGCPQHTTLRLLEIHGRADGLVAYTGNDRFAPIPTWLDGWAARLGCGAATVDDSTAGVEVVRYEPCPPGSQLEHVALLDGGHAWPAAATELAWTFTGLGGG